MITPLSKVIEINFNLTETINTLLANAVTGKQFNTADTDAWFEFGFTDANIQNGTYNLTLINLKDKSKFEHEGIAFTSNPFYYQLDSGADMQTNEIKHAGTWIGQLVVTLANGKSATQKFMFDIESHILDGTVASVTMLEGYSVLMAQIENAKELLDQYNIDYAALLADLEATFNSRLLAAEQQLAEAATKTELAAVASGSPKGTYATLTALQTAYPTGNANIYVVTANGNWYYWSGSAWTSGGVYQATGIADRSLVYDKLDYKIIDDIIFNREKIPAISVTNNSLATGAVAITGGFKIPVGATGLSSYTRTLFDFTRETIDDFYMYGIFDINDLPNITLTVKTQSYTDGVYATFTPTESGIIRLSATKILAYARVISSPKFVALLLQVTGATGLHTADITITTNTFYFSHYDLAKNAKSFILHNGAEKHITVGKTTDYMYQNLSQAVDYANARANKDEQYILDIYDGMYDVIAEKGGTTWLNSISMVNGQRQGIVLGEYVHLVGHGTVNIKLEIPDEIATLTMSTCLSTINMWTHNRLENINVTAKNCRYCVHDESSNTFDNGTRNVKKCTFNHKGNIAGLWASTQAYGAGTSGGGRYNFEDCIFEADGTPWSMHNNDAQTANVVSFSGCYFKNRLYGHGIGFGWLGTNAEHNRVFIKDCMYSDVFVHVESGQTGNNVWDIYNFVDNTVTIGA